MATETIANGVHESGVGVNRVRGYKVDADGGLARLSCTLTGVSPLLFNAMPADTLLDMWDGVKPAKTASKPTPREWCEARVHRLPDGRACVPVEMFTASLINAGVFVRMDGKRQVSTANKTNLPDMLSVVSADMPLLTPGSGDPAEWEVDIRRGVNPNGGQAVVIIRPRFDRWEFHAEMTVDQKVMPLAMARELIELAGRRMGIGDFRPNRKGPFGRFAISKWVVGE